MPNWSFDETEDLRGLIHTLMLSTQVMASHIMMQDPEKAFKESQKLHEVIHHIERLRSVSISTKGD